MKNLELQKKAELLEALVNNLCEETSAEQTYKRLLALGTDIGITDEDLKDWGFNPFEPEYLASLIGLEWDGETGKIIR